MGGHEDGVLAFAENVSLAVIRLLQSLAKAVELEQRAKVAGK